MEPLSGSMSIALEYVADSNLAHVPYTCSGTAGLDVPIPKFLLNDHASHVEPYVKHADAPSTVIPAPLAAAASAAPHATLMFKSSTSKVEVLSVVYVPVSYTHLRAHET